MNSLSKYISKRLIIDLEKFRGGLSFKFQELSQNHVRDNYYDAMLFLHEQEEEKILYKGCRLMEKQYAFLNNNSNNIYGHLYICLQGFQLKFARMAGDYLTDGLVNRIKNSPIKFQKLFNLSLKLNVLNLYELLTYFVDLYIEFLKQNREIDFYISQIKHDKVLEKFFDVIEIKNNRYYLNHDKANQEFLDILHEIFRVSYISIDNQEKVRLTEYFMNYSVCSAQCANKIDNIIHFINDIKAHYRYTEYDDYILVAHRKSKKYISLNLLEAKSLTLALHGYLFDYSVSENDLIDFFTGSWQNLGPGSIITTNECKPNHLKYLFQLLSKKNIDKIERGFYQELSDKKIFIDNKNKHITRQQLDQAVKTLNSASFHPSEMHNIIDKAIKKIQKKPENVNL